VIQQSAFGVPVYTRDPWHLPDNWGTALEAGQNPQHPGAYILIHPNSVRPLARMAAGRTPRTPRAWVAFQRLAHEYTHTQGHQHIGGETSPEFDRLTYQNAVRLTKLMNLRPAYQKWLLDRIRLKLTPTAGR
jgi:hypothetical protein